MDDRTLFDVPANPAPYTRRQALAFAQVMRPGRRRRIIELLTERPRAIFEISAILGVQQHQIAGRFSELVADGLIERTGETRPTPSGCQADVYRVR